MPDDKSVLSRSLRCRVPRFTQTDSPTLKADKLSDHVLETSLHRADLAALRMQAHLELREARQRWRNLSGWEVHKPRSGDRTKEAEFEAKRKLDPQLADLIETSQWTIARCDEEMERLDKDATRCNQAYTMVTNG